MALYTRANIEERYQYLIGNTSTTADTVGTSHINAVVRDICNSFPFSWNRSTTTLSLTSGQAEMPSDYNPQWGVEDVRLVNSGSGDDSIYQNVTMTDRDKGSDYYFWITYDSAAEKYYLNTKTQSGTLTVTYFFQPAEMSTTSSKCIIPDYECVAYGAAAKNWIADERDRELKADYYQEYQRRVQALYRNDLMFGPTIRVSSKVSDNPELSGLIDDDITIQV